MEFSCLDAVLSQKIVDHAGLRDAEDHDESGDDHDGHGQDRGGRGDELDAEDAQQNEDRDDQKVQQDLRGAYIGDPEEVGDDVAGAGDGGGDSGQDDDDVEDLEQELHLRARIHSGKGVSVVVKAVEAGKLQIDAHDERQKAHGDDREQQGAEAAEL